MKNLGYYNGEVGLIDEMRVPMNDRAFYFGDGVYDAVMCRNNIPYLLSEHIDRFYRNCDKLSIKVQMKKHKLFDLICTLVKMVDATEKFVYFHMSRGSAQRAHELMLDKGNLCIMIMPRKMDAPSVTMSAVLLPDIRYEMCDIKTLNLLPNVLASQIASKNGVDEAILHRGNSVTEGTHCNVSIISYGRIITAPESRHILPGVTRAHLIQAAERNGITVEQREYTVSELLGADEILVTSSSKLLRSVNLLNGKQVGGKDQGMLNLLKNELFGAYYTATTPRI